MSLSSVLSMLLGVGFRRRAFLRPVQGQEQARKPGQEWTRSQPVDVVQSRPQLVSAHKNVIKIKALDVARFVLWVDKTGQGGLVSSTRVVQLYREWCALAGRVPAPQNEFLSVLSRYVAKQRLWVTTGGGSRRRLTFYQIDSNAYA